MRSPEQVAHDFYQEKGLAPEQIEAEGPIAEIFAEAEREMAELIRQRDAEWQERLGRAFDAGVDAESERERGIRRGSVSFNALNQRLDAARRAAVESAPPAEPAPPEAGTDG